MSLSTNLIPAVKAMSDAKEMGPQLARLRKATDQLESFMFKQMLSTANSGTSSLFGKVPGGEIYRDMFEQSIADSMAQRGALGISNTLFEKTSQAAMAQLKETNRQKHALEAYKKAQETSNNSSTNPSTPTQDPSETTPGKVTEL